MSWDATRWAWRTPADGLAKYVLLALADYADSKGASCYPSLGEVASKTGLGTSTVRRLLRQLESDGLIKVRVSSGGRHARSDYKLLISQDGIEDSKTQPERAGKESSNTSPLRASKQAKTRPARSPKGNVTQPERAGINSETQPERRETQPERARNPTRAGDVVPTTSHEPVIEPTTTKTAVAVRGKKRPDDGGNLALIEAPVLAVQSIHSGNAVQVWVDAYRAAHPGVRETAQQKGQVSREFRQLQEAGNDSLRILRAVQAAGEKGFATISREFSLLASGRTNGNGHAVRASTTENRVGVALALAETLRAEEAQAR